MSLVLSRRGGTTPQSFLNGGVLTDALSHIKQTFLERKVAKYLKATSKDLVPFEESHILKILGVSANRIWTQRNDELAKTVGWEKVEDLPIAIEWNHGGIKIQAYFELDGGVELVVGRHKISVDQFSEMRQLLSNRFTRANYVKSKREGTYQGELPESYFDFDLGYRQRLLNKDAIASPQDRSIEDDALPLTGNLLGKVNSPAHKMHAIIEGNFLLTLQCDEKSSLFVAALSKEPPFNLSGEYVAFDFKEGFLKAPDCYLNLEKPHKLRTIATKLLLKQACNTVAKRIDSLPHKVEGYLFKCNRFSSALNLSRLDKIISSALMIDVHNFDREPQKHRDQWQLSQDAPHSMFYNGKNYNAKAAFNGKAWIIEIALPDTLWNFLSNGGAKKVDKQTMNIVFSADSNVGNDLTQAMDRASKTEIAA